MKSYQDLCDNLAEAKGVAQFHANRIAYLKANGSDESREMDYHLESLIEAEAEIRQIERKIKKNFKKIHSQSIIADLRFSSSIAA